MGIQDDVLDAFLNRLTESEAFTAEMVEELRGLLESSAKPKAEQIVKVLATTNQKSTEKP